MATAGRGERRSFGVFWDIENCRVPKGGSARELVGRIRKKLYNVEHDKEAEFMCVCDASKENKELMKELNSAQVTIIHVDATNKNAADEKLRQRMRYFVETHKPPATVVLISGDVNFEGLLSDIKHRNQLDTILIHPDRINEGLRQCVQQRFAYTQFTDKLPSRPSTSKSAEHDCVIHGLPCGRDKKVLSLRLHQLSENCGGKVLIVDPPNARIRFKDLELAERAGGRMDGEDVFGAKISVDIAPTPALPEHYFNNNNGYQSPRTKKKLRKKRGSKSEYHSSDGSGNSPQSSPQGSPKSSPYRQRSPGRAHFTQSFDGPIRRGASPQRMVIPPRPYSDLHSQFATDAFESSNSILSGPCVISPQHAASVMTAPEFCNGHGKFMPTTPPPVQRHLHDDDPDPEMENLPWNQKQMKASSVPAAGSSPHIQTRERHHSYTPSYAYKKPTQRNRTLSDPPISSRQRTPERGLTDSPRTCYNPRQSNYSSQPSSPFRDPRGRGFRGGGGGPGRRFSRSRSNSSNRSNQSSPSLSDSGDHFSVGTTTSVPSFVGGSPPFLRHGGSDQTPESASSHRCYNPLGDFHLRVTNLDCKKEEKELKDELKKYFQRHAKVEDISIEYLPDDSVIGIIKVSTLKAAERAAAKLHRTTKIGCKRIHVYLRHNTVAATKLKANIIELLKEKPDHTLKWFKFVEIYEKRHPGTKMTLTDVQQFPDDVLLLNDEQTGHTVQLLHPVTHSTNNKSSSEDASKPTRWSSPTSLPTLTTPPHAIAPQPMPPQTTPPQTTPPQTTPPQTIPIQAIPLYTTPLEVTPLQTTPLYTTCLHTTSSQITPSTTTRPEATPLQRMHLQTMPLLTAPARTSSRRTIPTVTAVSKSAASASEQVTESDLCSLHCPPGSPEARAQHYLPAVHLHRKAFAAQVHTLLLGHNGSMPLKSFLVCYLSEFSPPPPGEVPMEHLISAIPGVCITAPHSLVRHVQWAANTTTVMVPHLSPLMLQLAREVTVVLSSVPRCTLAMSEFPPRYHSLFHKPCCFTDYGHSSLHSLMEALPHVVRIFGWGSWLEVSLTHAVQLRRFVSDLRSVLRSQPQWAVPTDQLANAFCNVFRKAFNVSDYGACYIEDLLADLPGNIILVCHKDGVQTVELTWEEVLLDFAQSIVGLLRAQSGTDVGLALPRFLSAYHAHHTRVGMQLSDYGVASVRELIHLIPSIVKIERKSGRDVIRLVEDCDHHLKVKSACQVLVAFPDPVMMGSDFIERYRCLYGESLDPAELHTILHGLAEVTQDESGVGQITIRMLSAESITRNLCAILEIRGPSLSLDHLLAAYTDTYGSAPLVSSVGFSSVQDFVKARPDLVMYDGPDGAECVSLVSTAPSDICGNIGAASKSSSSPELENAAHHLKSGYPPSTPKVNNMMRKPTSLLNKGMIDAALGLYHCDLAMNNCKQPETLMLLKKRGESEGIGLHLDRNKLAQSVVQDCVSVPPPLPLCKTAVECASDTSCSPSMATSQCNTVVECSSVPLCSLGLATDHCKTAVEHASVPPCSLGVTVAQVKLAQNTTAAADGTTSLQLSCSTASEHPAGYTTDCPTGGQSCSRVASSRPGSRTASNSSGSPLGSPLTYPGTPRRNRMAAKFSNPCIPTSPPLQSDSDV